MYIVDDYLDGSITIYQDDKMKIAYISPMFLPLDDDCGGAVEQLMLSFIKENEEYKNDIYIDTYTLPLKRKYSFKKNRFIEIGESKFDRVLQKIINGVLKIFYKEKYPYIRINNKVANNLMNQQYDVILIENSMFLFKTIHKKYNNVNSKANFFYHIHNSLGDADKNLKNYSYVLKNSKKIFAVSDFIKEQLDKGLSSNKVVTIKNCIDFDNFIINFDDKEKIESLRSNLNLENNIVFGYAGRVTEEKGVYELICAFKRLSNEFDTIKLIIIGSSWFADTKEDKFTRKLNEISDDIKDKIIFTGYIDHSEIKKYYCLMNSLIIPSKCNEAFGLVALEGMTLDIPIISTGTGGLKEVLDDYALYVNVDDLENSLYLGMKDSILNINNIKRNKKKDLSDFSQKFYYKEILKEILDEN